MSHEAAPHGAVNFEAAAAAPNRMAVPAATWAWRLTFLAAFGDALAMAALGFTAPLAGVALPLGCAAAIYGIALFYRRVRPDEVPASLAESASLLITFTLLLAIASYLAVSLALPLRDGDLAALDLAIGFDWRVHQRFVAAHPALSLTLQFAYELSIPLVAVAVIALALTRRLERLGAFILLVAVTATVTVIVSGLLPAAGAYVYFQPGGDIAATIHDPLVGQWHLTHFLALRDGSLRAVPLPFVEGLITFPSFHAQLAVITAWALLGVRWLALPGLAANLAVIYSAIGIGGHHLTDIVVGCLIALAAILLVTGRRAYPGAQAAGPASGAA